MDSIIQKAEKKGLSVEVFQEPVENKEYSYWYGGELAKVMKGDEGLLLAAIGDVVCTYRYVLDGEELETYVKDKGNNGVFDHEMSPHIKNDKELVTAIKNSMEEGKLPQLNIDNNNWFEVFVVKNGEVHDVMYALDEDTYTEALEEIIENFDSYVAME